MAITARRTAALLIARRGLDRRSGRRRSERPGLGNLAFNQTIGGVPTLSCLSATFPIDGRERGPRRRGYRCVWSAAPDQASSPNDHPSRQEDSSGRGAARRHRHRCCGRHRVFTFERDTTQGSLDSPTGAACRRGLHAGGGIGTPPVASGGSRQPHGRPPRLEHGLGRHGWADLGERILERYLLPGHDERDPATDRHPRQPGARRRRRRGGEPRRGFRRRGRDDRRHGAGVSLGSERRNHRIIERHRHRRGLSSRASIRRRGRHGGNNQLRGGRVRRDRRRRRRPRHLRRQYVSLGGIALRARSLSGGDGAGRKDLCLRRAGDQRCPRRGADNRDPDDRSRAPHGLARRAAPRAVERRRCGDAGRAHLCRRRRKHHHAALDSRYRDDAVGSQLLVEPRSRQERGHHRPIRDRGRDFRTAVGIEHTASHRHGLDRLGLRSRLWSTRARRESPSPCVPRRRRRTRARRHGWSAENRTAAR